MKTSLLGLMVVVGGLAVSFATSSVSVADASPVSPGERLATSPGAGDDVHLDGDEGSECTDQCGAAGTLDWCTKSAAPCKVACMTTEEVCEGMENTCTTRCQEHGLQFMGCSNVTPNCGGNHAWACECGSLAPA